MICRKWHVLGGVLLALALIILFPFYVSAAVTITLTNGSFETGNLSGWTTYVPSGGYAIATTQYQWLSPSGSSLPKHGSYFALLKTDGPGSYTTVSQSFYASAGNKICGWAFFKAEDYMPYNDSCAVYVKRGGTIVYTAFSASVSTVGNYGSTPWTYWQYTCTTGATYTIEARIANYTDDQVDSVMGLDFVGNLPPAASAGGPYYVNEGASVQLYGYGTDPEGGILTYAWDLDNNGTFETSGQNPLFSAAGKDGPSSRTVALRVTDNQGASTTALGTVNIQNVAPTVTGPVGQTADEGAAQSFSLGSFTDPAADNPWTVEVDWGDGTAHTAFDMAATGTIAAQSHTYADGPSTYTATVQITDKNGDFDIKTFDVAVANVAPVVDAGADASVDEGGIFTGSGSFTDPGADTWTATVDYGDGKGVQSLSITGNDFNLSHVYVDDGLYTVTVTVSDDNGGAGNDTAVVTVNNIAPTADAGADASILEGGTFMGSGSFTDPGADIWTATVDYGDGTGVQSLPITGKNFNLSHVYADGGLYTVTVTVSDDDGGVGSDTANINMLYVLRQRLVICSTDGGEVTEPGEGTHSYLCSTVVNLVATPDAGCRFVKWTGSVGGIDDVNVATTTIRICFSDLDITANFQTIPPIQYNLTASSATGGSVAVPGEGTFACNCSTVLDLIAEAGSGYRFVNWTGDVGTIANVNGASTTITMNDDYSVVANFAEIPPDQVALTVSSSAVGPAITTPTTTLGSVTAPGEATFTYDKGTVVNLEAEPEEGCRFVVWIGDVDDVADVTAASTTITMNGDYSITATFKFGTGCFVATAAYGTPMAGEIQILRDFRDEYMLTNPVGETLVDIYYRASPPIAEFITEHSGLRAIVRAGLMPAVAISTVAVNTSPVEKAAILALLVLISVALGIWAPRRRGRGPKYI